MRSRRWWIITLALLALGTACSSPGGGAREGRDAGRVIWVDSDVHWVSQPVAAGGRFVGYLERDRQLAVAAVDPSDGKRVWELPASASSLTPGVAIHLAHDDRNVYFGTPVDVGGTGSSVFVVAVDAASGAEVWRTGVLHLAGGLYACMGDDTMLCTTGRSGVTGSSLRIAKATGEVTSLPLPSGSREIGDGLYDLAGRDPEVIAAIDATGRTLWTRTASELFEGRPVSSDYGWNWDTYGNLLVGWLGRIDRDRSSTDLSLSSIAGIDAANGAVVWVVDGVELGCALESMDLSPGPAPLRCRRTGTVTWDADGGNPVVTGLNVVVEQFDPATGATLWETDLGAAESIVLGTPPVIRLSSTEVVVGRQDGTSVVLDVGTGQTRAPGPGETGWCSSENLYQDLRTYATPKERLGQDFLTPCRLDGSPIDVLAPDPPGVVAASGEMRAWVDASGMHGATTG